MVEVGVREDNQAMEERDHLIQEATRNMAAKLENWEKFEGMLKELSEKISQKDENKIVLESKENQEILKSKIEEMFKQIQEMVLKNLASLKTIQEEIDYMKYKCKRHVLSPSTSMVLPTSMVINKPNSGTPNTTKDSNKKSSFSNKFLGLCKDWQEGNASDQQLISLWLWQLGSSILVFVVGFVFGRNLVFGGSLLFIFYHFVFSQVCNSHVP